MDKIQIDEIKKLIFIDDELNKLIIDSLIDDELNKLIIDSLNGNACDIAKVVYHINKNLYIYENNNWYYFNNHIWEKIESPNTNLYIFISNKLGYIYLLFSKKNNININMVKNISINITNIINESIMLYKLKYNNKFSDIFDQNIYLIGFNNGIYDLKNNEFRNGKPDDFISRSVGCDFILKSVGYDYINYNLENGNIENIIEKNTIFI